MSVIWCSGNHCDLVIIRGQTEFDKFCIQVGFRNSFDYVRSLFEFFGK